MGSRTTKTAFWQAFGYAWQFGYTIVVPLVVFALLGAFFDRRFGTKPWLFLAGILLAIVSSSVLLVRKAFQITRAIEREHRSTTSEKPHQKDATEPPSREDPSV